MRDREQFEEEGTGPSGRSASHAAAGALIVNADDWGRDKETTERILECVQLGVVSSVSGMVFMEDSERAATVAREFGIDVGLHLNFTTPFSMPSCPNKLVEHQQRLGEYLKARKFAQVVYHPGLADSFEYVVTAQLEQFRQLYGAFPDRIDGHHHMHLCSNVLMGRLLPQGTIVRRNFSFDAGEKSICNRWYRRVVDGVLARRHHLTDFFFSLPPMDPPDRLRKIFASARDRVVELETHPINSEEYQFLAGGEIFRWTDGVQMQSFRSLRLRFLAN
jgi:hypothetical protein